MTTMAEKRLNIRTLEGYVDPIILSMPTKILIFCFPELLICNNICLATNNPLDIIPLVRGVIRQSLTLDDMDEKSRTTIKYLLMKYSNKEIVNDWMNDKSLVKKHEDIRRVKTLEFEKVARYHFTKSCELSKLDPTLLFIALIKVGFRGEIKSPYSVKEYTDFDSVKKIVSAASKSCDVESIRDVVKDIIVDRAKHYKNNISHTILPDIYKWHKEFHPTPTLDTTFRIFICNHKLVEYEEYIADMEF
jgi:hypothetical protein